VQDRGDQSLDVAVIEAGDGVAQVDRDAAGEAGRQLEDTPFPAGAGQLAGMQGGGRGVPVDGGHRGPAAGAVLDEPGGEVVASQEGALGDEQGDAGFERVEAGGC
jgi:hypothetical protein